MTEATSSPTGVVRSTPPLRILYVAEMSPTGTAYHRYLALCRLGHRVTAVDTGLGSLPGSGHRLTRALWSRRPTDDLLAPMRSHITERHILQAVRAAPDLDLIWIDKGIHVAATALQRIRACPSIAPQPIKIIHYSSDPPFALRRGDPSTDRSKRSLPLYDACVTPGEEHRASYEALGARAVHILPFCYEPTVHFPNPDPMADANRPLDIVFIGTPLENRKQMLLELRETHGVDVHIFGGRWRKALSASQWALLSPGPEQTGDSYRTSLWKAKLCLGFYSPSMGHVSARRWVEIAACGGVLLAQQTEGLAAEFALGEEAESFHTMADLAVKAKALLADPDRLAAMRRAALARVTPGRSNDAGLDRVLAEMFG